jgi:hypothetical protein
MNSVRSAFQAVYFYIFAKTAFEIFAQAVSFETGIQAFNLGGPDKILASFVYPFFLIVVGIHILRLYVTMEMIEDEEGFFEGFYNNLGWKTMLFEWILRISISALVTLKTFAIDSLEGLIRFLFFLYMTMFLWSLFMRIFARKSNKEVFLWSSLSGLFGTTCIVVLISYNEITEIAVTVLVFMLGGGGFLAYDITTQFYQNWKSYKDVYSPKFDVRKWGTGSSVSNTSMAIPSPVDVPPPAAPQNP